MDVFISYSRKDSLVARQITQCLEQAGISYFIDVQDISGGMEFPEELANALHKSKVFLFLASRNSYASAFTLNEIMYASNIKSKESRLAYIIDDSPLPTSIKHTFLSEWILNSQQCPVGDGLVDFIGTMLSKSVIGKYVHNENDKKLEEYSFEEKVNMFIELVKASLYQTTQTPANKQKRQPRPIAKPSVVKIPTDSNVISFLAVVYLLVGGYLAWEAAGWLETFVGYELIWKCIVTFLALCLAMFLFLRITFFVGEVMLRLLMKSGSAYWTYRLADMLIGNDEQLHRKASLAMGLLYFHGKMLPQDYEAAYHYLVLSDCDAEALYHLGLMFHSGLGVEENITNAIRCFRDAESLGSKKATVAMQKLLNN